MELVSAEEVARNADLTDLDLIGIKTAIPRQIPQQCKEQLRKGEVAKLLQERQLRKREVAELLQERVELKRKIQAVRMEREAQLQERAELERHIQAVRKERVAAELDLKCLQDIHAEQRWRRQQRWRRRLTRRASWARTRRVSRALQQS